MIYLLPHTETILVRHREAIGNNFNAYRGHCYRVLNYMRALGMNEEETFTASVLVPFHDLGIWTHGTMDYLHPSVRLAIDYIRSEDLNIKTGLAREVIVNHHKLSSTSAPLAEKLRKADLVDLSMGLIRHGIPKNHIKDTVAAFPYHGFHWMIFKKVLKHAVSHLRNPFPMLRW